MQNNKKTKGNIRANRNSVEHMKENGERVLKVVAKIDYLINTNCNVELKEVYPLLMCIVRYRLVDRAAFDDIANQLIERAIPLDDYSFVVEPDFGHGSFMLKIFYNNTRFSTGSMFPKSMGIEEADGEHSPEKYRKFFDYWETQFTFTEYHHYNCSNVLSQFFDENSDIVNR